MFYNFILIPTQLRSIDLLRETVNCALKQINQSDRIIITNDGIEDDNNLINLLKIKDNRILVSNNNKSYNSASTRNNGISYVSKYIIDNSVPINKTLIFLLDDDDLWCDNYLKIYNTIFKSYKNCLFLISRITYNKNQINMIKYDHNKIKLLNNNTLGIIDYGAGPSSFGFRLDFFLENGFFDENINLHVGKEYLLRLKKSKHVYLYNDKIVFHRIHNFQSTSDRTNEKILSNLKFYKKYRNSLKSKERKILFLITKISSNNYKKKDNTDIYFKLILYCIFDRKFFFYISLKRLYLIFKKKYSEFIF
jgi:hypothetical protein